MNITQIVSWVLLAISYEGHNILLDIMEVNNDEAVMKLLPITFVDIDVFIICFSLVCQNSFSNIKNYWIEKINKYCPGRPIILVGTKCDLRDKEDNIKSEMIQTNQIEEMKDQIGALKYIECSAKERHNLNEVMTSALDIVVSEDYESPQDAYKRLHPKKCYIS